MFFQWCQRIAVSALWHSARLVRMPCPFAHYIGLFIVRVRKMEPLHHLDPRVFFGGETEVRAQNVRKSGLAQVESYPSIGYRQLNNALVTANRRVSSVVQSQEVILPAVADAGPWELSTGQPYVAGFLRQSNDRLLLRLREEPQQREAGIYIGTWSPHNWFHWLIDTLPAVFLCQGLPGEYDSFPLILPRGALDKESWREPFELVRGERQVTYVSPNHYARFKSLVWVDSPTNPGPPSAGTIGRPKYTMHLTGMQAFRNQMLEALGLDEALYDPHRKIFIMRNQAGNRPYNQADLVAVAQGFGFEPVWLEELSFRESVIIMLESRYVIGPHGAGWANALFCRPGTQGLMWTWRDSILDNWFSNIAQVAGMVWTVEVLDNLSGRTYDLDPSRLRQLLSSTE